MSRSGAFCPRCGDEIPERPAERPGLEEGGPAQQDHDRVLCDACYFDEFDLVDAPERIEVRVCSQCGAVHRGNRWVDVGAEDYTDIAVEEVSEALGVHVDAQSVAWQVAPEQVDKNTIRMHAEFSGVIRETPVTEEVVVPVKISRQTCQRCGKIAGGSYATVIQLRGDERTPSDDEVDRAKDIANDVVAEMEATGDREAFISEMKTVPDGLNVKASTTKIGHKIAKRLVEELGGSFSDSETLVTEDEDGNGVYRVTYAVRLPRYRPGEVIDPEGDEGPVLVRSVRGNLKGIRVRTGEDYEASFEDGDAPEATRLGTREDAERATLVTVEDDHAVQVLDPETFEAKTVPRPDYMDAEADEVPVLKSREGLHVLPDDE
ncbi:60S ribosomal export protein NMD3 [Haloarculaceae archaeon H-GB2-1]|nr:NMD3-related protein [Haloarculaceae archaeon H-GB1-1]MEA5388997.1 60S ribosomal export protein NMD3 [Haloarculaceae archaeon H-GB11]MEA5407056.1 60S ribosomal export protein NMD3 [Haloarculaceae archaeon H-GB2-1]